MKSKLLSSTLGGLFALMLFVGCSAESDDGSAKPGQTGFSRPPACYGKCDGPSAGTFLSPYEADLEALHRTYGGAPLKSVEQAFSVQMDLGEVSFTAPTHLFGGPVNIIPYADEDALSDAAGRFFPHRDEIIAKLHASRDVLDHEPVLEEAIKREDVYHGPNLHKSPDIIIRWQTTRVIRGIYLPQPGVEPPPVPPTAAQFR